MARLPESRKGERLSVRGLDVEYSFWPAKKSTRWKLQRRLYVKEPWAILSEAVYRHQPAVSKSKVRECTAYVGQAEEYFNAAVQSSRLDVKPVLLYYALLNLAKCLVLVRNPSLDMAHARHGLVTKPKGRALLGDQISIKLSATYVNIFDHLFRCLECGTTVTFTNIEVRHLLPQILVGHRLWTYACNKPEKFLAIREIGCYTDQDDRLAWLRVAFSRGEIHHLSASIDSLIKNANLPGKWRQVSVEEGDEGTVWLEPEAGVHYEHRPVDCVQKLFQSIRPALWCAVTGSTPHRKYYVLVDSKLGKRRMPQWASMYVLLFYLSDLTRYRPHHFDRFIESKYGPQIESLLDECPRQFLYLLASELLEREVAPATTI